MKEFDDNTITKCKKRIVMTQELIFNFLHEINSNSLFTFLNSHVNDG